MALKKYRVFGFPGTGKTTFIVNKIKELIEQGTPMQNIMCLGFTNQTVNEFKSRFNSFKLDSNEAFRYFRTIHSLCNYLRKDQKKIFSPEHYKYLKDYTEEEIQKYFYALSLQRENIDPIERIKKIDEYELENFKEKFNVIKQKLNLIDFNDMLDDFCPGDLEFDYLFVDEGQDLSMSQYKVIDKLIEVCKKDVYVALDDAQSIFGFAGAEVKYILNKKDFEDVILPSTYRLPSRVFHSSLNILKDIGIKRYDNIQLKNEKEGKIEVYSSLEEINFERGQEYLILVRNSYLYNKIKHFCIENGFALEIEKKPLISQKKIDLVLRCFREKKELSIDITDEEQEYIIRAYSQESAKVRLSTIHQEKGSECKNVILFNEVTRDQAREFYGNEREEELRVLFVAFTRAKENLFIIDRGKFRYDVTPYIG